jgi:hypothetical protein
MDRMPLVVFLSAMLGVGGALLAYDRLVVQPRAAAAEDRLQMDLAPARRQARQVTAEMQASIDRSVAGAQQAMDAEAQDLDRRRLLRDALSRAAMFRSAVAEHVASSGTWPRDHGSAGLPPPDATAGGAVRAIRLGEAGLVDITLGAPFADGSGIALRPRVRGDSQAIEWDCRTRGDPALRRHLPECR